MPHLSGDALADLLLAAVATQENVVQISEDVSSGLLGADAAASHEAAQPLPPEVVAVNQELQETAAKLRKNGRSIPPAAEPLNLHYWTGRPADAKWSREDIFGNKNTK